MKHDSNRHHWTLAWTADSGDQDRNIHVTADSIDEARAAMDRILSGVTWTPEDPDEIGDQTEPAYTAIHRDAFNGDMASGLLELPWEGITFPCDSGTLTVERER